MKENRALTYSLLVLAVLLFFPAFSTNDPANLKVTDTFLSTDAVEETGSPVGNVEETDQPSLKTGALTSTTDDHSFILKFSNSIPDYTSEVGTVGYFHPDGSTRMMFGSQAIIGSSAPDGVVYKQVGAPYNFSVESQFYLSTSAGVDFDPLLSHDFDNDGLEEVLGHISSDAYPGQSAIFIGWNGSGYSPEWNAVASQINVEIGAQLYDTNNDGQLELITNTHFNTYVYSWDSGFKNFHEDAELTGGAWSSVGIGDIDNDGKGEIITSEYDGPTVRMYSYDGANYVEEYSGNFQSRGYSAFCAVDIDNDGELEIVAGTPPYAGITLFAITMFEWNAGTGDFDATNLTVGSNSHYEIRSGDIDGDGVAEALTTLGGESITVIERNISGEIVVSDHYHHIVPYFRLFDVDGDGDLEIISRDTISPVKTIIYDDDIGLPRLNFTSGPEVLAVGETWVTINWTTNNDSYGWVRMDYSQSMLRAGSYAEYGDWDGSMVYSTTHGINITGLLKGTTYYYYIYADNGSDGFGSNVSSVFQSFMTEGSLITYLGTWSDTLADWNGEYYGALILDFNFQAHETSSYLFELEITWNGLQWIYHSEVSLDSGFSVPITFNFYASDFIDAGFTEGQFCMNQITVKKKPENSIALELHNIGFTSYYHAGVFGGEVVIGFLGDYQDYQDYSRGVPDLVIKCFVNVFEAGDYQVIAELEEEFSNLVARVNETYTLSTGPQWLELRFIGYALYSYGYNGNYSLRWVSAHKISDGQGREVFPDYYTVWYNHEDFNPGIRYDDIFNSRVENWNGRYYEYLVITLDFDVTFFDTYKIILQIEYDDKHLQRERQEYYGASGYHGVEFWFEANDIVNILNYQGGGFHLELLKVERDVGGLWPLAFELYNIGVTTDYNSNDFGRKVSFTGNISSKIENWGGQKALIIEVEFEIFHSSYYKYELQISDNMGRTWFNSQENSYSTGKFWFRFEFAGNDILNDGYQGGPFYVDWLYVYDQNDGGKQVWSDDILFGTDIYLRSDFETGGTSDKIRFTGSDGDWIEDLGGENFLIIEFEFEIYYETTYRGELQISDDLGHTWYALIKEHYSTGYYWFRFEFPGHDIRDNGFQKGSFSFDWLNIYEEGTGELLLEFNDFGETGFYNAENFGGGNGDDDFTFSSPGFELLLAILTLPMISLVRRRK